MIVELDNKGRVTVSPKWLAGYYRDGAVEIIRDRQNPKVWGLYVYGILKGRGTWNGCFERAKFE